MRTYHGKSHNPEFSATYKTWQMMRARCNNPNYDQYRNYGGRGIKICARWDNFELFLVDMGKRPSLAYSIERIDNSKGYEPGNCRWATKREQQNNRRDTIFATLNGVTKPIKIWAAEFGLKYGTVDFRIHGRRWTPEEAVSIPVGGKRV